MNMKNIRLFAAPKTDYTIIVGCGRLGANLASALSDEGHNVLIMDSDRDSFRRLSASYGGLSVVADGTDLDALRDAEISDASAVIAVTNRDNTNIMVAQLAQDLFHVDNVIARLYDPERESVYQEFGIKTICPAVLSAKEIDKLLADRKREEAVRHG